MHCQQPHEAHTLQPDGDSACPDGKNTFNFEFQINPEVAAYVQANMDKSPEELTQGWIEHIRARDRARAAARAALQRDGAAARAKADSGATMTLFDALETIGAMMDEHWHGEWTGPILFNDPKGASRMILVEQDDHDQFAAWYAKNPRFSGEEIQDHARAALVRMCSRPIRSEGP